MIIDIIVILFVVLGAYIGYKKGIINVLTSFIAILVSLVLAFLLQMPVANLLRQSNVGTKLNTTINQGIKKAVDDNKSDIDNTTLYSKIVKGILSDEQINEKSENITMFILKGLSFFAIFVIVTIIMFVIRGILNIVFDLPILNSINSIGGLGLGALKSILIIYIILALIAFISPIPEISKNVNNGINNTNVVKILYENNLLVKIIENNIN